MNTIRAWHVERMLDSLNDGLSNTAIIEAATVGKGIDASAFEAFGKLRAQLKHVRRHLIEAAVTDVQIEEIAQ